MFSSQTSLNFEVLDQSNNNIKDNISMSLVKSLEDEYISKLMKVLELDDSTESEMIATQLMFGGRQALYGYEQDIPHNVFQKQMHSTESELLAVLKSYVEQQWKQMITEEWFQVFIRQKMAESPDCYDQILTRTADYGSKFIKDNALLSLTIQFLFELNDQIIQTGQLFDKIWGTLISEGRQGIKQYKNYIAPRVLKEQLENGQSVLYLALCDYFRQPLNDLFKQKEVNITEPELHKVALDCVANCGWWNGLHDEKVSDSLSPNKFKILIRKLTEYLKCQKLPIPNQSPPDGYPVPERPIPINTPNSPEPSNGGLSNPSVLDIKSAPETWSVEQVAQWLRSIKLEGFVENFKQNQINGSVLISDGFDDAIQKELIPQMNHRIIFKSEWLKLKSREQPQRSILPTGNNSGIDVILIPTDGPVTVPLLSENNQNHRAFPTARIGKKATCPKPSGYVSNRNNIIDLKQLLKDDNCIHCVQIDAQYFDADHYELFKKWSSCLCSSKDVGTSNELDQTFNTLVDKEITPKTLMAELIEKHSLKIYVVDSLKRYHSLMDIIHILPSCTDVQLTNFTEEYDTIVANFLNISDTITKSVLLTTTIESMSCESQCYFGTFIKKNDLPLPFAYYIWNMQKEVLEYKINFNLLAEVMCFTTGRYILQVGSQSTIGMGKTSLLQFIFPDKRIEALNTDGSSMFRNGCIDVLFPSDTKIQKDESYVIFDVHGTINGFNEDIITSIQEYCTFQIFYVTEQDLNGTFLNSMMNYSKNIQSKPTIIIIFDSNYDDRRSQPEKLINRFQSKYQEWKLVKWTIVPPGKLWYQPDSNKANKDLARSQRLVNTFADIVHTIFEKTKKVPNCTSIFSIHSYYPTVKNLTNISPPVSCRFEIQKRLATLFNNLNETTENLRIVTPVSYFDSAIKQCEKESRENWDAPQQEIQNKRNALIQERSNITSINSYTTFFIELLTGGSYIELLVTERFLEKWRYQFESTLRDKLTKAKNEALEFSSKVKQLEERLSVEKNSNELEKKKLQQDLSDVKSKYKEQLTTVNEINTKLVNIDLTIGLFCDEIMALYEFSPHIFDSKKLVKDIAIALTKLMLKGFSIHILRGRPLHCHSRLIEESIKYIQTTDRPPLVLTIIGEQSSAKSSLMNTTFGCNFRVSTGRCTIGMYMNIIKWKSETIVIFDTEGLLSLEEAGSIFDNQMVTMAVLSSHLVLINHKGEFSVNFQDLIGMSFYAKLHIRSSIKPKLLFVLRDQADLTSKTTFFQQLTKLKEQLQHASIPLKSSIDDELDIYHENVYLLPNAFSYDENKISGVTQCWRNRTFPKEIIKLRNTIFDNIKSAAKLPKLQLNKPSADFAATQTNSCPASPIVEPAYTDMTHLYAKISSNWEAIDLLGPGLLECKTLYELSIMKELQAIAIDIIKETNVTAYRDGENLIDQTLLPLSRNNFIDMNRDRVVEQFNNELSLIITRAVTQAQNSFNEKAGRTCYPGEIKLKVSKSIEPPIRCAQHLLKQIFEERFINLSRKARVDNAQKELLNLVQKEFDRNKRPLLNDLNNLIDADFQRITEQHQRDLQSSFEPENIITEKILELYCTQLKCKQGETTDGNIYDWLFPITAAELTQRIQKFVNCWPQRPVLTGFIGLWKSIISLFISSQDKQIDSIWTQLKDNLGWFTNNKKEDKNKKLFKELWTSVIQTFNTDLSTLIKNTPSISSDPKTVLHLFQYIENAMKSQCIINDRGQLEKHTFCSDLAAMGLNIIINGSIDKEKANYELKLTKSKNELKECKENLLKQYTAMKDSFELGQTLAETIGKQIINEIGALLQRRIEKDMTEDIAKSQFINHEAIQKQAYEESISQANGENILKYVYDINRYFIELSLKELKTTLHTVTHKHTLDFEHLIVSTIDNANNCVQQREYQDTFQLRDDIRNAILTLSNLNLEESADAKLFQMFSLSNIVRMPIKDVEKFRKGFQSIRNNYKDINEKAADLIKNMKPTAFESCKKNIAQKLGCQARCPGCGAKCSKPEPHEKENVEVWQGPCQKCPPDNCTCKRPEPISFITHESTYHLASAFCGWIYYKLNTPFLKVCYQNWTTEGVVVSKISQTNKSNKEDKQDDDYETIFPKAKYYNQTHPAWYSNLKRLSTEGMACKESIPPPDQRRAWMVTRHAIVNHYKNVMIDHENYDDKLYPHNVDALPEDFEPRWKDETFE